MAAATTHVDDGTFGASIVAYACNLEVFSLMLREGYVERRVGLKCYAHMLNALLDAASATNGDAPPFMLRMLADAAVACVRTARVQAGARLGFDTGLAAAERRADLLGPDSLEELRNNLASAFG